MKTCSMCGSTWSDRIDFCFHDGTVLVAGAPGTLESDDALDAPSAASLDAPGSADATTADLIPLPLRPIRLGAPRPRSALPLPPPPPTVTPKMPRPGEIVEEVPIDEATEEAAPPRPERRTDDSPPPTITKRVKAPPAAAPVDLPDLEEPRRRPGGSGIPWLWVGLGGGAFLLLGGAAAVAVTVTGALTIVQADRVASRAGPAASPPEIEVAATAPAEPPVPPPVVLGVQAPTPPDGVAPEVVAEVPAVEPPPSEVSPPAPTDPTPGGARAATAPAANPAPKPALSNAPGASNPGSSSPPTESRRAPSGANPVASTANAKPSAPDASPWGPTEGAEPAGPTIEVQVTMDGPSDGVRLFVDGAPQPGAFPHNLRLAPGLHKFKVEGPGGSYEIGKPVNARSDGSAIVVKLIPPGG